MRGAALDPVEIDRARTKLRWALGRHAGAVSAALLRVDVERQARCRLRLKLTTAPGLQVEATGPSIAEAIDRAIERGAAAVARAVDAARLLGG